MPFINSPLRYPGGKSSLSWYLAEVIKANALEGATYVEPFAGGAGAAIDLLLAGTVKKLCLNDADPSIYSFWEACLNDTSRFLESVMAVDLTIEEWEKQRSILVDKGTHSVFDVGFAAFYMNRTSRSGILTGGPIGGKKQNGKWLIDARFNREGLCNRIERISRHSCQIEVHCLDVMAFLKYIVPNQDGKVFIFLDPPYYKKGQMLYMNAFVHDDHARLAEFMREYKKNAWVMTYDDDPVVRELYSWCCVESFRLNYSAKTVCKGSEIFIRPKKIKVPDGAIAVKYGLGSVGS